MERALGEKFSLFIQSSFNRRGGNNTLAKRGSDLRHHHSNIFKFRCLR